MGENGTAEQAPDLGALVAALAQSLRRAASLPVPVPEHLRLPDGEWAEAVIVRGEAPYGRCGYCQCALGVVGCLNLCDMPTGMAREFTHGLMDVLNHRRSQIRWVENLAGCTCGPPRLTGYQTARDSHARTCPMA